MYLKDLPLQSVSSKKNLQVVLRPQVDRPQVVYHLKILFR